MGEPCGSPIFLAVPERNAAERQIVRVSEGASFAEIYAEQIAATTAVRAVG